MSISLPQHRDTEERGEEDMPYVKADTSTAPKSSWPWSTSAASATTTRCELVFSLEEHYQPKTNTVGSRLNYWIIIVKSIITWLKFLWRNKTCGKSWPPIRAQWYSSTCSQAGKIGHVRTSVILGLFEINRVNKERKNGMWKGGKRIEMLQSDPLHMLAPL